MSKRGSNMNQGLQMDLTVKLIINLSIIMTLNLFSQSHLFNRYGFFCPFILLLKEIKVNTNEITLGFTRILSLFILNHLYLKIFRLRFNGAF